MATDRSYGIERRLDVPYDEAVERVTAALQAEGFGILTEIDVKATLKKKLDLDFRRYVILGACNPPLAHRALSAELDVGLLLPCNVIVYEDEGGGGSVVSAADPGAMMEISGNPALGPIAAEARARLERALGALAA
jgi:uncharacterized protein (DUF302 family)